MNRASVEYLIDAGAHVVLAAQNKVALRKKWEKAPERLDSALAHIRKDGLLGVIPYSLGLAVLDVDECQDFELLLNELSEKIGTPLAHHRSGSGTGWHLWYKAAQAFRNRKWRTKHGAGDIRCANGYVIIWDIAQVEHAYKRTDKVEAADLSILPSPRKNWQSGARNDTLNKKVYDLAVSGTATKDDYISVLKQAKASGLTDTEIAATFNSAKKAGENVSYLENQDKISLPLSADGLNVALKALKIDVRFNVLEQCIEIAQDDSDFAPITDIDEAQIKREISRTFRSLSSKKSSWEISQQKWSDYILSIAAENPVNPVVEYLDSLQWDGTNELAFSWLSDFWHMHEDYADEVEYVQQLSAYIVCCLVNRAYQPGCKRDILPVIITDFQGSKKSYGLELLCHSQNWFSDSLNLSGSKKEQLESTLGFWLVEVAEMLGVYGARDIDKLKAYLTRRSDKGVRLAYDKRPKTHMRQWFAVGTTNNIDIIPPDPSGVRRFATVRVAAPKKPFSWLVQNRDQIFAHAKHLIFSENYKEWEFDNDAEAVRRKFAEKHQQHYELWESKILDHFDEIHGLSMNEICDLFADNSSMNPKGLRAEEVRRSWGKIKIELQYHFEQRIRRNLDGVSTRVWLKKS